MSKNFIDFEKSQNFPKIPKVRSKTWNAWRREGLKAIPVKKSKVKVEEHLGMKFWVSERCLGGEKTQISWERSKRIQLKLRGVYILEFHKTWLIESYRGLKTCLLAIEPAIEDLMRGFLNNEARWIKVAIEELSRRQKVSRLID